MLQELQSIKEQLFDAPSEVKEAFNAIVGYFDQNWWVITPPTYDRLQGPPSSLKKFEVSQDSQIKSDGGIPKKGSSYKVKNVTKKIVAGPFKTAKEAIEKGKEMFNN